MSSDIRVVIVDNNRDRRSQIVDMLPDYVEAVPCDFGENAYTQLRPGDNGRLPDAVILAGDDPRRRGLETFIWMRNRGEALRGAFVPVLVLTDDEFSDAAMEFYEVDDVIFYEGEPDEDRFYSAFVETLDMPHEEVEYNEEPVYVEKHFEKLIGMSFKEPEIPAGQSRRVAVITNKDTLDSLSMVVKRGQEQAKAFKALQAELGFEAVSNKKTLVDEDDIPEEFRMNNEDAPSEETAESKTEEDIKEKIERARKRALQRLENDRNKNSGAGSELDDKKATIVVVDDHEFVRKIFEMTLSDKYNVVSLPSAMKAVDYFVQDSADLIFMDVVMPGMSGVAAMNSIRWQKNGETVPCVYLMGNDYTGSAATLSGNYVCGTLPKPVSKGAILTAVEHLKRFIEALN